MLLTILKFWGSSFLRKGYEIFVTLLKYGTYFSGLLISSQILPLGVLFVLSFLKFFSELWNDFFYSDGQCRPLVLFPSMFPCDAGRLTLTIEMPFQVTYSLLNNCSPLWCSSNFVVFLMTLKFGPPLNSSIVFLASCSFSSIAAICLEKSNWLLCQLCCSWENFSLKSEFSLCLPKRASLRKVISFSLAVKIQEIKVNIINTWSKSRSNWSFE